MSKEEKKQEVCPNCGYCPCCGRANEMVKMVPYPMPQPYPVPMSPYPWTPVYPRPVWIVQQPPQITYGNISVGTSDDTFTMNGLADRLSNMRVEGLA